jgi:photoactive yellow protein
MIDTMTETAWAQGARLATSGASFVRDELLQQLDTMSSDELDALDFGVVKVTDVGIVEWTNVYEAELTAVAKDRAVGRNWFTDVVPCANNRLFYGIFKWGVASGSMNLMFFYTFTFNMSPTEMKVHLFRSTTGANWVLVKRK